MTSKDLLKNLLELNTGAIKMTLKDVTSGQAAKSPHANCNSAHFVLGHIATYRLEMVRHLGVEVPHDLGKTFAWGAKDEQRETYPPLKELHQIIEDTESRIRARLDTITDAELEAEGAYEVAPMPKTVEGVISFLVFHETYHVGQLGYQRRFHGQEGAFG